MLIVSLPCRTLLQCASKILAFKMRAPGIHMWIIKYSFM